MVEQGKQENSRLHAKTRMDMRVSGLMRADVRVLARTYGVSDSRAAEVLLGYKLNGWEIADRRYEDWKKAFTRSAAARIVLAEYTEFFNEDFGREPIRPFIQ